MNNQNNGKNNDRRNFLKTAGATVLAASLPLALSAQKLEKEEIEADARGR
jgi:hypothetical protein